MSRRWRYLAAALLLLLALPLPGCGRENGSAPSEKPEESREETPMQEESPAVSDPAKSEAADPETIPEGYYFPAEPVRIPAAGEETAWELRFSPSERTVNFVELPEETTAASVTVRKDGETLYQSFGSDSRLCRFDTVRADKLTVLLEGDSSGGSPKAGFLPGVAETCAYLPASANPGELEAYAPSFQKLRRVVVITGLCWDETGEVVEIDGNYPALMQALRALRDRCGFELFATLYPARSLIRAGTAGEITAQNHEALTASILAHAAAYALDGIDLDWETPADESEWRACSALIAGLGPALRKKGLSLSAALYPESLGKLSAAARPALDRLHLMTYDQFDAQGRHATFSGMADAVQRALEAGYAPEQISAGLPAYGRPLDASAAWPLYREQPLPLTENQSGDSYFNNPQMVRDKAAYCSLHRLGGVFFFPLTGDLPADDPDSLLGAVDERENGDSR